MISACKGGSSKSITGKLCLGRLNALEASS
jgi:hypothetical protein